MATSSMSSRQRIQSLLAGRLPDRPPHFDLLRNDAVISHFAGEPLTVENGERVVYKAANIALDGTRTPFRIPNAERVETLPDGRKMEYKRWTIWIDPQQFDLDTRVRELEKFIAENRRSWSSADDAAVEEYVRTWRAYDEKMHDIYLFWGVPFAGVGLGGLSYTMGFEQLSFIMAYHPDLVSEYLEICTAKTVEWIQHLARHAPVPAFCYCDDIAMKGKTIFSPDYLRTEFFIRLKRITDATHEIGTHFFFHTDGNVMDIIEDIAATGVDILNPIETVAGMDIAEVHRRAPGLILCGGVDISELLPHGTPEQVAEVTRKAIADAEGRIMVGSSSELHNEVPLENYLAMYNVITSTRLS